MLWSTWQGTIWRGAMLVLLLWAGLAWTQTSVPPPAAERIMVVHENGKATRCRVIESWQLPDRRIAHLLQSTETLEKITIVDEHAPTGDVGDVKNARSMAKRIYAWGANRNTPPEGSPVPPNLRVETPANTAISGPAIINKPGEEKLIANVSGSVPATNVRPAPKEQIKIEGQVVEFDPPVINVGGPAPLPSGVPATTNPPAIPQVNTLTPPATQDKVAPSTNPRLVAQPIADPCPPIMHDSFPPGTIIESDRKSWRPGDKLQAWLLNRAAMKSGEIIHMEGSTIVTNEVPPPSKVQFSTAMSPKVEPGPLAISKPAGTLPAPETVKPGEKHDMWGNPLSAKPEPKVDPLLAPDRITPKEDIAKPKAPIARPAEQWPLNSQSALAAKSGMQGPVVYVPYPIVTVPQPHHPPTPPDPKLPEAPQLNAFVNAFTPPPMPKGQANPGQPGMMPQGNPMLAQQQMMQQQMMHQQMMQQQMLAQQNRQGMMPSQGPMTNGSRQYQGPMPPNLIQGNGPMQAGFLPPMMPPQQPMLQQANFQQPAPAQQSPVTQQVDQLIKAMREAPYPGQREWAAQQLVNFDWRANPAIIQAMLVSASHDPAVSVRAGCVYCLGRMQASVEPVVGTLNSMRNDNEPRVRQEVEQALVRLGQTPAAR